MFLHLVWVMIVCCALAYGVFFVAGKIVFAQSAGINDAVAIRDELAPSSHHLSGILMVPHSCDELEEHIDKLSDTQFKIVFETWQDPAVPCKDEPAARAFRDELFAPATGVDFLATMNDQPLAIEVFPVINKQVAMSP